MRFVTLSVLLAFPFAAAISHPVPPRDERREQVEAVETISKLGGEVSFDYQRGNPEKPIVFDPDAKPKGRDEFHRVVRLSLRDTKATDADLKVLHKLPYLENLDLTGTLITSEGMASLRHLKNLRVLSLSKTRIGDKALKHIQGLTKMWQLHLSETDVTDAGLIHLKGMTALEPWLDLSHTGVTDDGVKHLTGFTKLVVLNLRFTPVTEKGYKQLRDALPRTQISYGP